jgi:hypothetical protein
MPDLDSLYEDWISAEQVEQSALLLHGAHQTIESLALYEQSVEKAEAAREAYAAARGAHVARTPILDSVLHAA